MRKAKNRGHQILDKDLQKASGGTVSKVIFADGSVRYITSESESSLYVSVKGRNYPICGLALKPNELAYMVGQDNVFYEKEDACEHALSKGWSTEGPTFSERIDGRVHFWKKE